MSLFNITDYKIGSDRIFRYILLTQVSVSLVLLIVSSAISFTSGPLSLFLGYFFVSLMVALIGFKKPDSPVGRVLIPILNFTIAEYMFLTNLETYYFIFYWLAIIPIVALILQGLKVSLIWTAIILVTYYFHSNLIESEFGSGYEVVIRTIPSVFGAGVYLGTILSCCYLLFILLGNAYRSSVHKNEELSELKRGLEDKKTLLQDHNTTMITLSRNTTLDIDKLFEEASQALHELLKIDKVSIWLFSESHQVLERMLLVEDGKVDLDKPSLSSKEYPIYFQAIQAKSLITAPLVHKHYDIKELREHYAKSKIKSIIDCPILLDQEVIGVLCCEHVKYVRNWNAEDVLITQSFSDFIALQFKNQKIQFLMKQLQNQNQELSLKGQEIEVMNDELSILNQKLIVSNNSLESKVQERTETLMLQNNKLKQYAFVNSHILRAPLSNLIGISDLLLSKKNDTELIEALKKSTVDLDQIVRMISLTLEDKNSITRDDIDNIIKERFSQTKS